MNQLLPREVVDQIMREEQHFAAAPQAFFEVWTRGVAIAGPEWFGGGTREVMNQAKSKWDLRPNMLRLKDALGVLSSGERSEEHKFELQSLMRIPTHVLFLDKQ